MTTEKQSFSLSEFGQVAILSPGPVGAGAAGIDKVLVFVLNAFKNIESEVRDRSEQAAGNGQDRKSLVFSSKLLL